MHFLIFTNLINRAAPIDSKNFEKLIFGHLHAILPKGDAALVENLFFMKYQKINKSL